MLRWIKSQKSQFFELSFPWSTAVIQAEGCVWEEAAGSVVMKISVLGSHFGGLLISLQHRTCGHSVVFLFKKNNIFTR